MNMISIEDEALFWFHRIAAGFKMLFKSIFLILLFSDPIFCAQEKFPCPLQWVSTQEFPVEQHKTQAGLQKFLKLINIAKITPITSKVKLNHNYYYWGKLRISSNPDSTLIPVTYSLELQSFVQLLSNGNSSEILEPFYILTNPNNCSLKLASLKDSSSIKTSFLTKITPSNTKFLAVSYSHEHNSNTATVVLSQLRISTNLQIETSDSKNLHGTYLLQSFVKKIDLQIKVVELLDAEEKVEKFEIRFQSHDKLVNKGGAIKEETIHHSLLLEKTWKSTFGISLKIGLYLMLEIELVLNTFGIKTTLVSFVGHLGFEIMADLFLRHHIREVVSMSVGQTLRIPPHTSVDVSDVKLFIVWECVNNKVMACSIFDFIRFALQF